MAQDQSEYKHPGMTFRDDWRSCNLLQKTLFVILSPLVVVFALSFYALYPVVWFVSWVLYRLGFK